MGLVSPGMKGQSAATQEVIVTVNITYSAETRKASMLNW